jgi:hypothetical protein
VQRQTFTGTLAPCAISDELSPRCAANARDSTVNKQLLYIDCVYLKRDKNMNLQKLLAVKKLKKHKENIETKNEIH